jgi:hypothetical protein
LHYSAPERLLTALKEGTRALVLSSTETPQNPITVEKSAVGPPIMENGGPF